MLVLLRNVIKNNGEVKNQNAELSIFYQNGLIIENKFNKAALYVIKLLLENGLMSMDEIIIINERCKCMKLYKKSIIEVLEKLMSIGILRLNDDNEFYLNSEDIDYEEIENKSNENEVKLYGSRIDDEIIKFLRHNNNSYFQTINENLNINELTLRKHMARLIKSGVIYKKRIYGLSNKFYIYGIGSSKRKPILDDIGKIIKEHPNCSQAFIKSRIPGASTSTIYRNVNKLLNNKEIIISGFRGKKEYYKIKSPIKKETIEVKVNKKVEPSDNRRIELKILDSLENAFRDDIRVLRKYYEG